MRRLSKPGLWLVLGAVLLLTPMALARLRGGELARSLRKGNLPQVKSLLSGGADVNTRSMNGTTALMVAADAGDVTYVRELISRGAAVETLNHSQHSALYWAAAAGKSEVVNLLLAAGASPHTEGPFSRGWDSPRAAANRAGHRAIASLLAEREVLSRELLRDTQAEWMSPADNPLDPRRLARWKGLLERGASPRWNDINGDSLMAVVMKGDEAGVRLMLDYKADPSFRSRSDADLMCVAATACSPTLLDLLLDRGGRVEGSVGEDETPLGAAVYAKRLDNVQFLLSRGADPNRTWRGKTILTRARELNQAEVVRALLERGACD